MVSFADDASSCSSEVALLVHRLDELVQEHAGTGKKHLRPPGLEAR